MTNNPGGEGGEHIGTVVSGAEKLSDKIVTPLELVADGYNAVLISTVSGKDRHNAREWRVADISDMPIGVMTALAGLRKSYYGVDGVVRLYIARDFAATNELPFIKGRDDTLAQAPVAKLFDISGLSPRPVKEPELEPQSEPPRVEPIKPQVSRERSHWRDVGRRVVGAVALAAVFVGAAFLASLPSGSKNNIAPRPTPSISDHDPNAFGDQVFIPLNLPPTIIVPNTPPKPPEVKPPQPPEQAVPSIKPDLKAPTLWAMFARVVGTGEATNKITALGGILESKGYQVIYHGDPDSDNEWWVVTIVGPDGKTYATDRQVASLLASVS